MHAHGTKSLPIEALTDKRNITLTFVSLSLTIADHNMAGKTKAGLPRFFIFPSVLPKSKP